MNLHLLDKTVLSIRGNATKFLQGLSSNTPDQPRNAFLNAHGRIIAVFDQVLAGDDEFLIAVQTAYAQPLTAHLDKFARLNKTTITPSPLQVYFDLTADAPLGQEDYAIAQKHGRILLTRRILPSTISPGAFTLFRLKYQIPVQGIDYTDEMVLNVDEHEFVSYTKGCFLGQEPVAKVHSRSKPSWKLIVRYEDELTGEQKLKLTSRAADPNTGRAKGFILLPNG